MAVSPDGQWIYVPTADGGAPWQAGPTGGRLLVVNAKTLKIDQIIQTRGGPHHIKAFSTPEGEDRIIVELQGNGVVLLDPNDEHKVVGAWTEEDFAAATYQVDANPAGTHLYVNLHLGSRGVATDLLAAVGKVDLETGRITYITGVGKYTNGFAFTSDGKFTYVADSITDHVFKIDNSTDKVVAKSMTGVAGPYNIELNDDETELWIVGKGEMTYNLGDSISLVDTRSFRVVNVYNIGGQTIDHDIFNPADSTELWVTSSGTAEIIVFDTVTRTVKDRIPTANGGDTHSGAFVSYTADFVGTLLADNSGRRAAFLDKQKEAVNALASN
jgi:DNA-binding beta-propeller fold protein YncE